MDENYMMRNEGEKKDNELIYSDNHIANYEEQACCSNFFSSTFGSNNIFGYINDVCFKEIPINDEEIINNININQEVKTPLCSNKKKVTPNDDIILNNNNNINNQNLIRNNSLASNPSNDSAAEPIIPLRRSNTSIIKKDNNNNNDNGKNNQKSNFFSNIANIFKDLFGERNKNFEVNDDLSDKQSNNSNNILDNIKRPALRKFLNKDKINKNRLSTSKNESKTSDKQNLFKEEEKEIYFDEILNFQISENNDEDLTKLVSAIPAFIVKKNKNKDSNNKYCPICLSEFMIGEKESSLPCLHCFHSNCIEKWLKRSKFCPVCKLTISWESLNPKF